MLEVEYAGRCASCVWLCGGRASVCGVVVRVFVAREKYSNVREDTTGVRERGMRNAIETQFQR